MVAGQVFTPLIKADKNSDLAEWNEYVPSRKDPVIFGTDEDRDKWLADRAKRAG